MSASSRFDRNFFSCVGRLHLEQAGDLTKRCNRLGNIVPGRGLEPLRISPPDPKSGASANFATLASSEQAAPPPITARAQKMQSVLQNHLAKFISVRDSRNRRVRGLYQRNGHYYAQLWVDRGYGRKSARKPALQPIRYFSRHSGLNDLIRTWFTWVDGIVICQIAPLN